MPLIIGVDPGQTTGIFCLYVIGREIREPTAIQFRGVLSGPERIVESFSDGAPDVLIACESFVVGPRAGKSRSAGAGKAARDIIGALKSIEGVPFIEHPAVSVKRWATDKRLAAAGLMASTTGMRHARDAARHALFTAVANRYLTDPLSTVDCAQPGEMLCTTKTGP